MRKLALLTHLGLGDMLLQRGMVGALCDSFDHVAVVCARKYLGTLTTLFEALENVALVPVDEAHAISPAYGADPRRLRALEARGYSVLRLGYHAGHGGDWCALDPLWSRALYVQAGLDPALIHDNFVLPTGRREQAADMLRRARRIAGDRRIVLVHDDPARPLQRPATEDAGHAPAVVLHVDDPRIRSDNLFDYVDLLAAASHVHALDSCFALLVDLAGLPTPLTIHAYARDPHAVLQYGRSTTHVAAVLRERP